MASWTIPAQIDHTGTLSKRARAQVKAHLRKKAEPMEEGETRDVELTVSDPVRSMPQHRLYFAIIGRIVLALDEAGYTNEEQKRRVHAHMKLTHLELVAAEVERETGEVEDIGGLVELFGGRTAYTLTTTRLSKAGYSLFIERVASDDVTLGSGADISDLLAETRDLMASGKIRSGRIMESSEEATMDFSHARDDVPAPLSGETPLQDEPFASPPSAGDEPAPGPLHEAPQDRPSAAPRSVVELYAANPHDATRDLF